MLLLRFIAIGNLRKTQSPIDEDQKMTLLLAPFTGTTLFEGELAKLHEANTKHANAVTVYPTTASYPQPYIGRGKSFNYRGGYSRRGSGRSEGRAGPHQMPQILTLTPINLKMVNTLTTAQSPTSKKPETSDDSSQKKPIIF